MISETEGREEEIINEINGTETDCIISVLPSPYQEMFIGRNRSLLNVKLWLGCGAMLADVGPDNILAGWRAVSEICFPVSTGAAGKEMRDL